MELEPFCISLEPTQSNVSCNIILKLTSSLSGYLEGEGNCHGFVGTVILIHGQDNRQLAHLSPPNQILWAHEMEGIERALVTVYENVLHHELLDAAHWVESPDVEYIPNITLRTASVIQAADFTENSLDNLPTNDEKAGIDPFSSFNQIWASKTFGNWSRDLDLSCVTGPNAKYKKVWIVGTSESRHLFEHICFAIENTTGFKPLDKGDAFSQCHNFYYVSMCSEGGQCGCDFIPTLLNNYESDLSHQFVSATCGLHQEYLQGAEWWETKFLQMKDWAAVLNKNNSMFQFRTTNAVNPFKAVPPKLTIARNNVRTRSFRDMALSTLGLASIPVLDAFEMTEAVFDQSADHVHYPEWIYAEIARVFLESLCHDGLFTMPS